jgi:hypothetical protein
MHSQARAFICSGLFPAISAGFLLSACALDAGRNEVMPAPSSSQLQFLVTAINATPEQREKLWRANRGKTDSDVGRLRIALLESLPAHSGYDPAAALRDLKKLSARRQADADIRNLAQLRLSELETLREYQASNADLQRRLDQIIAIERGLDRNPEKEDSGRSANIGR